MFIGLGIGTQIYSCASTGKYTWVDIISQCNRVYTLVFRNVGASAELVDASCLYGTSGFANLSSAAFAAWNTPASVTKDVSDTQSVISAVDIKSPIILGQHYFITDPVAGLSPEWDFTTGIFAGNSTAFVVAKKIDDDPSPTNSAVNIDWLYLTNVTGTLATEIYRIDTQGGQPPASVCICLLYKYITFALIFKSLLTVHIWRVVNNICQVHCDVL